MFSAPSGGSPIASDTAHCGQKQILCAEDFCRGLIPTVCANIYTATDLSPGKISRLHRKQKMDCTDPSQLVEVALHCSVSTLRDRIAAPQVRTMIPANRLPRCGISYRAQCRALARTQTHESKKSSHLFLRSNLVCSLAVLLLRHQLQGIVDLRPNGYSDRQCDLDQQRTERHVELGFHQRVLGDDHRNGRLIDAHRHNEHARLGLSSRLAHANHGILSRRHWTGRFQPPAKYHGSSDNLCASADHILHRESNLSRRWTNHHPHMGHDQRNLG